MQDIVFTSCYIGEILLLTVSVFILYVVCVSVYIWKLYLFYAEGLYVFEKVFTNFIFQAHSPLFFTLPDFCGRALVLTRIPGKS